MSTVPSFRAFRVMPRVTPYHASRHAMALSALSIALLIARPSGTPLHAQRDRDRDSDSRDMRRENGFTWSGIIASGHRVMIRNINGPIQVERSTSGRVEISAEKRWRRGDPQDVRIEQQKIGDDLLVCALWTEDSRCTETGIQSPRSSKWNDRNDVAVEFTLRVPDGVRVDLTTVNGGVSVSGVTTDVRASTVNGSIDARSAGGPVRASTVNGGIHVAMGSLSHADDLEYSTVNGSVVVELPTNFSAQLDLSTVNGRVSTDFPVTVSGTLSPRRLRGTIGDGATRMRASTVNGSITLRRN